MLNPDDSGPVPFDGLRPGPTSVEDRRRLWQAVTVDRRRIQDLETTLPLLVQQSIKDAMPRALLSEEEHDWVQLAIKRESQSIALRKAIIEKTLTALIWATIVGAGAVAWRIINEWAVAHGWKP